MGPVMSPTVESSNADDVAVDRPAEPRDLGPLPPYDPALLPHLDEGRIEPQVGVRSGERSGAEALHLSVQLGAESADLALAHPRGHPGDEGVDGAGGLGSDR